MYFLAINIELTKIKVNKYNTWLLFTQKYFFCNYLFTYPICTQPFWVLHSTLLCTKSFLTKEESKWPRPTVQVRLTVNKETSWALGLWVICAHVTDRTGVAFNLPPIWTWSVLCKCAETEQPISLVGLVLLLLYNITMSKMPYTLIFFWALGQIHAVSCGLNTIPFFFLKWNW